jgi:hypothetical protein
LNPLILLGKSGVAGFSGLVNRFNKDAELLDDLNVCQSWYQASSPMLNGFSRITGLQRRTKQNAIGFY